MARKTFGQQDELYNSNTYDDTLTMANAESSATDLLADMNYLRTQFKTILGETNWFDAPDETIVNLAARATLEAKLMLWRTQVLADISVPAAQNYVVLGAGEIPSANIAISTSNEGGVTSQLAGAIGSHDLAEIAGLNALNPKNLCIVVDGSTGDPIMSSGREVHALLQVGTAATDGNAFASSGNDQPQLSFVRYNSTHDDLEAVPVADIQSTTINYSYVTREDMASVNEQVFLSGIFSDQTASVDVTLDNAIDNQSGPVTQTKDIEIEIGDGYSWNFQDESGNNILNATVDAGTGAGDSVHVGDGSNPAQFKAWGDGEFVDDLKVDTGGQTINIGVTAGQIDSSSLEVESTVGNLNLKSASEMVFTDSRLADIEFTDATYNTLPGGATSIVGALNLAYTAGGDSHSKAEAEVTSNISADTLIGGPSSAANIDADLLDYDAVTFVSDVNIFINGRLMRNGANAAANLDVYPSAISGERQDGEFYCEFALRGSGANRDQIIMQIIG